MRMLLAGLALLGLMTVALADDKKDEKKDEKKPARPQKKEATLKVGDDAPALKATKWLQGDEVKSIDKDRIYVVEFWATWCGPCIVMMPHLSEIQQQYKKDVTVIGFTAKDQTNTEDRVIEFVKKRGGKLKYTFAYADDRDTYEAWMTAAGRGGIPCTFVVAKGKIVYVGHPMYLDVVLPKVVSGKWKVEEDNAEVKKIEDEVTEVFKSLNGKTAEAGLDKIAQFEKKHPELAGIPYFTGPRLNLLLQAKKTDEAQKFAEKVVKKAKEQDDPLPLRTVSMVMRGPEAKKEKELLALSLEAAEALVALSGDKDVMAQLNLAETRLARDEKDKALVAAEKALAAAEKNANELRMVSTSLRAPAARQSKELLALSLKAAEAVVKISGEKDAFAMLNLAETHLACGDKDKAKEAGKKAMDAAGENPNLKRYIEQRLKAIDDTK